MKKDSGRKEGRDKGGRKGRKKERTLIGRKAGRE
jgi:hypothetical protein